MLNDSRSVVKYRADFTRLHARFAAPLTAARAVLAERACAEAFAIRAAPTTRLTSLRDFLDALQYYRNTLPNPDAHRAQRITSAGGVQLIDGSSRETRT